MLGYLDQPEETVSVLKDNWLKTGDQAALINDYLYISGRADDIFQVAGEKIAPLEIENCLQACAGVQQVAIYPQADPLFGNTIIALIEGEVNLAHLKRHVRQHLAAEKRPQSWYAVTSLPLTPMANCVERNCLNGPDTP
jgi:acyl-CoA synthetase (AMP-forming)/AMP-acid ligase II